MDNPFAGLLSPHEINRLIENIFLITLNPEKTNLHLISSETNEFFTLSSLEFSLFEKIMDHDEVIIYLFESFQRVHKEIANNQSSSDVKEFLDRLLNLIFQNLSTILKQPEIVAQQNLSLQIIDIFKNVEYDDYDDKRGEFLSTAISRAMDDNDDDTVKNVTEIFYRCFDKISKIIAQSSLMSYESWILPFLMAFVSDKNNRKAANLFIDYNTPAQASEGIKYSSNTLLGQLLSLSITPKNHMGPYEYYDNLNNTTHAALNNLSSSLWNCLKNLHDSLHNLVKSLLVVGGDTRDKTLNWLGCAITSNQKRGQIWNQHSSMVMGNFTTSPDSFMIGLSAVLLRLCAPLMKPQLKVLMVDPTYCAVKSEHMKEKQVHMSECDKETCLIPCDENEERATTDKYNFITEVFFLAHKSIDLSFRVCIEKVLRMNREIHRLQMAYQDAASGGASSDVTENIMSSLSKQSQILLCTQNLILEPENDKLLCLFYEASSIWLNQLAMRSSINANESAFAPTKIASVVLPLQNESSPFLKYVPEYILENVVQYLQFSKNFETNIRQNHEAKEIFFTTCLIFMGSSKRAKNPHLRAKIAESMESLLPLKNQNGFTLDSQLFYQHPHRLQMVPNLLDVFVSIEMTGQAVAFEQKFNYRRPMYAIMQYLWEIGEQRACFKELSLEAQKHIDDVDVPLFLRFINVLINDSIFLLDESLNNLEKIREMEIARNNNEWDKLPPNERQQNQQNLSQLGMLARFDNILGRDTINILKLLTSETKEIFVHPSMVDRITAMLNYFLLQLCGPNQKRFKVNSLIWINVFY
jgi:ubiquitin conjugation factor E4 A